jgi:tetratricopeptide (TPR) repeat protein
VRQGKIGDALTACEERIRRDGKDAFAYNVLAQVHVSRKDRAKAEEAFQGALAADPDDLETYMLLGRFYIAGEENRKAVRVYEAALAKKPDFWPAANDLAWLLCDRGTTTAELNKALALAQNALTIRPGEPILTDTLGWVQYRMGDLERALANLERAQAKLPDHPEINYHLGMAYLKAGKREEAKGHLEMAVAAKSNFPGREEAGKALAGISRGKGEYRGEKTSGNRVSDPVGGIAGMDRRK